MRIKRKGKRSNGALTLNIKMISTEGEDKKETERENKNGDNDRMESILKICL